MKKESRKAGIDTPVSVYLGPSFYGIIQKGTALKISIHKALTSLDTAEINPVLQYGHFNPQGSHEPRHGTISLSKR